MLFLISINRILIIQAELQKASHRQTQSESTARIERNKLCAALQGVVMELAQVRSSLNETKTDMTGLQGVHSSIVRLVGKRECVSFEIAFLHI